MFGMTNSGRCRCGSANPLEDLEHFTSGPVSYTHLAASQSGLKSTVKKISAPEGLLFFSRRPAIAHSPAARWMARAVCSMV